MQKHVISCRPSGVVEAVQNDEFPLHSFGRSQMVRASDVVWSEDWQRWVARIRPEFRRRGELFVYRNKSRQACIDWEVEYLNNRGKE